MNLGTPFRVIRAFPTHEGRAYYRDMFHLKRWHFLAGLYGRRGVPGRLLGRIPILLNPRDNAVSRRVFLNGSFEVAELNFIRDHLRPGMIVADVGANIGVHTLVMADAVGAAGWVHAFEPSAAFGWLNKNLRLNRLERTVLSSNVAVGSRNGTITLYKCTEGNEAFTSASAPFMGSCNETFEAELITLDEYARRNKIAFFDFLKIDVEGHELEVFKGCEMLFSKRAVRRIMFEVNNTCLNRAGTTSGKLVTFLRENGFSLQVLDNDGKLESCPAEPSGDWTTVVALQIGHKPSNS
jgi:FkbM family methyltransferase